MSILSTELVLMFLLALRRCITVIDAPDYALNS